ncbi:hypothetical protein QN277_024094 [Acacia crassicarpa]|uniref:non-specific serine/threonine protein kinase n=1 Tax=Acacia crassicarpa TaxID=499986 RepID=A0AAE1MNN3_9FABA|nr:hypothetical protein QN277_024094 [Acacia crassicarpa]
MQICHRDLKLENTLLDGSPAPRLKICNFGYSKSSFLHSRPKSTVGTPVYIALKVLSRQEYDGKILACIWGFNSWRSSFLHSRPKSRPKSTVVCFELFPSVFVFES